MHGLWYLCPGLPERCDKEMNLLISGKGGQGVVFLSDVLARSFFMHSFDVRSYDSVGIARRNGIVLSHLRWGSAPISPVLRQGSADFAMILDAKAIPCSMKYLNRDSRVFLVSAVPDEEISSITKNVVLIDPLQDLPLNTFVLGLVFPVLELSRAKVESILSSLPSAALNLAAFRQAQL